MTTLRGALIALAILAPAVVACWATLAFGNGDPYREFYGSFADRSCCWTNRCCYEIGAHDVEDLGGGVKVTDTWGETRTGHGYRIKASGQVVVRTGFSPDGKYHRCACDPVSDGWKVWPGANTRCLFTPSHGS
jgi:hypothetical protein